MRQRLALIDLDTILYLVAYKQYDAGNLDRKELVVNHVKEFINTILVNVRCDKYYMVYQVEGHQNFRKYYYPDYKSNRPPTPEFITIWRTTILETFFEIGGIGVKTIESDDAICIAYHKYKEDYDLIIVSADKDLNQIPGEHYTPRDHKTYFVTPEDAVLNLNIQILGGDSSDGIKGIEGIGAKWNTKTYTFDAPKARKLLILPYQNACYKAYQNAFENNWYSEYMKSKFLVTLLTSLTEEAEIYCKETDPLVELKDTSELIITNIFSYDKSKG